MKIQKRTTAVGRALAVSGIVICVLAASSVQAIDYTWNVDNGTLNDASKWLPGGGPPGAGDTGLIGGGASEIRANTGTGLASQPDELLVTTNSRLEVSNHFPNDVVMDGGRMTLYTANYNVTGDILLRSDSRFQTGKFNTFSGLIQDDGGNAGKFILTNSTGTIVLNNANNTYTAGTEVHSGILSVTQTGCTGTGDMDVFPGGVVKHGSITLNSRIIMSGGTLLPAGNASLHGDMCMKSDSFLSSGAVNPWLRTEITDYDGSHAGRLIKIGSSPYTLYAGNGSGNNSFSGGLEIRAGRINVFGNNALGTGELIVHSGATLDFANDTEAYAGVLSGAGTCMLGGSATITVGGVSPGTNDTVASTLTVTEGGTLAISGSSTSTFHLASLAGPNDQVVLNNAGGKLTMGGVLDAATIGGGTLEAGDYTLFDLSGGTILGSFTAINTPNGPGTIDTGSGDVVLTVPALPAGTVITLK